MTWTRSGSDLEVIWKKAGSDLEVIWKGSGNDFGSDLLKCAISLASEMTSDNVTSAVTYGEAPVSDFIRDLSEMTSGQVTSEVTSGK